MNIILIGFMGSGKSKAAKSLSKLLNFAFVEMDELVYQKTQTKNMHEVFAKGGELLLRETEIAIAKEYASKKDCVISTGGGVVHNKIILDYFKESGGKVIFLNTAFEQIAKRLKNDNSRPLFKHGETAKELYDFRLPLYLHYADEVIDVNLQSAKQIALQIKTGLTKEAIASKGSPNGF